MSNTEQLKSILNGLSYPAECKLHNFHEAGLGIEYKGKVLNIILGYSSIEAASKAIYYMEHDCSAYTPKIYITNAKGAPTPLKKSDLISLDELSVALSECRISLPQESFLAKHFAYFASTSSIFLTYLFVVMWLSGYKNKAYNFKLACHGTRDKDAYVHYNKENELAFILDRQGGLYKSTKCSNGTCSYNIPGESIEYIGPVSRKGYALIDYLSSAKSEVDQRNVVNYKLKSYFKLL